MKCKKCNGNGFVFRLALWPFAICDHCHGNRREPTPSYEEMLDPMPGPAAPPNPGESGEQYAHRCGLILIDNRYYQKNLLEWMARREFRRAYQKSIRSMNRG